MTDRVTLVSGMRWRLLRGAPLQFKYDEVGAIVTDLVERFRVPGANAWTPRRAIMPRSRESRDTTPPFGRALLRS